VTLSGGVDKGHWRPLFEGYRDSFSSSGTGSRGVGLGLLRRSGALRRCRITLQRKDAAGPTHVRLLSAFDLLRPSVETCRHSRTNHPARERATDPRRPGKHCGTDTRLISCRSARPVRLVGRYPRHPAGVPRPLQSPIPLRRVGLLLCLTGQNSRHLEPLLPRVFHRKDTPTARPHRDRLRAQELSGLPPNRNSLSRIADRGCRHHSGIAADGILIGIHFHHLHGFAGWPTGVSLDRMKF